MMERLESGTNDRRRARRTSTAPRLGYAPAHTCVTDRSTKSPATRADAPRRASNAVAAQRRVKSAFARLLNSARRASNAVAALHRRSLPYSRLVRLIVQARRPMRRPGAP